VGVVADVRQNGVDMPAKAEMSFPHRQVDYVPWVAPRSLVIRTSGDQAAVAAAVRREIAAVDPDLPASDVKTMSDLVVEDTSGRRVGTLLLGAFAAVALLLASIGIYGPLSQRVAQMTPEIGVRRGMKLVLLGTAAGLGLTLRVLRPRLQNRRLLRAHSPTTSLQIHD
jgi:putative ABC transport system permease protein